MTRPTRQTASRRVFLQQVAIVSAVTASGGLGWADATRADEPQPSDGEHFVLLEWPSAPNPNAAGAVIVETQAGDFATFPAIHTDEAGGAVAAGTAVVELHGCVARSFAYSTDDEQDERPRFYGELKTGAIYEIENSTWLRRNPEFALDLVDGSPAAQPLRHFCFTFNATTLHCLAEKLTLEVRLDSFGDIAAELALRGLGD